VNAAWEFIDVSLLLTEIVDLESWVWDTTAVSRLDVWLVLAVAIAGKEDE